MPVSEIYKSILYSKHGYSGPLTKNLPLVFTNFTPYLQTGLFADVFSGQVGQIFVKCVFSNDLDQRNEFLTQYTPASPQVTISFEIVCLKCASTLPTARSIKFPFSNSQLLVVLHSSNPTFHQLQGSVEVTISTSMSVCLASAAIRVSLSENWL